MLKLKELRDKINKIDLKILELLEERAEIVNQVGILKKKNLTPFYIPEREIEILEKLSSMSKKMHKESIKGIFKEIISGCRALEKSFSILSFGEKSLFVALKIFGNSVNFEFEENDNTLIEKEFLSEINRYKNYDFIILSEDKLEKHLEKNIILKVETEIFNKEKEYFYVISFDELYKGVAICNIKL
ncbi:MAG: chorismate mutase [Fusobacteriaceae bacterium]|nr:chorismate mutase [Fusobacteriaceae bacterium]MBP9510666.1 chorismate mutase [Fusobacteriaceae bacterium]